MTLALDRHADGCDGTCPHWLATGAPTCLPYPCVCPQTRADAAERYPWTLPDPKCWWKTEAGAIRSRCACWGDTRDGKPGDCCSHHSANPRYVWEGEAFDVVDGDVVYVDQGPADPAELPPAGWHAPHDREPLWLDDGEPYGPDPRRERKPYVRRWAPDEISCPCATPWDAAKTKTAGMHCVGCHRDFANVMTHEMHRRSWGQECRDPGTVTDVDTGAELLLCDGDGVWRIDWAANAC